MIDHVEKEKKENSSLEEARKYYTMVLAYYLPAELKKRRGEIRALSVGVGGSCIEGDALLDVISEANPDLKVYFEGFDLQEQWVKAARVFNPSIPPEQFKAADATLPASFGEEPWDLVIIRNPSVFGSIMGDREIGSGITQNWQAIFTNSVNKLREGGYLYLTTHEPRELDASLKFLRSEGVSEGLKEMYSFYQLEKPFSSNPFVLEDCLSLFRKIPAK